MKKRNKLLMLLLVAVMLFAAACAGEEPAPSEPEGSEEPSGTEEPAGTADGESITLGYVAWDSEVASTNVLKVVLEDQGYDVEMVDVSASLLFQGVSQGDFDITVAAWLPSTHADYMSQYGDTIVDLGPNLDGTLIGLVVPSYMDIDSIEDLAAGDYANSTITGIDPGAGIMMATETVIEDYGLDYQLMEGSDPIMVAALADAIENEEEVIVTGWAPHWKFARWDLKFLEDPQGIYGGEEQIHTLTRTGFEEDLPEAYAIADKFTWTPDDMAAVMIQISEGVSPEEAAREWVDENQDTISEWIE